MGGLLAKADMRPGSVQGCVASDAVQVSTKAHARVLGAQSGAMRATGVQRGAVAVTSTGMESGAVSVRSTGFKEGAVRALGMASGVVNAVGAEHGAVQVSGLGAATGAFQTVGIAQDAVRATGIETRGVNVSGIESGGVQLNVSSDGGFYNTLIACGAIILCIISIVVPNIPNHPYPWIFLLLFVVLIVAGVVYFKKIESDRQHHETQMQQSKAAIARHIHNMMRENSRLYEEMTHSLKQSEMEELQRIHRNVTSSYNLLNDTFQFSLNSIQMGKDNMELEHERIAFTHASSEFTNAFEEHKRQICELVEEDRRYNMLKNIDERAANIRQRLVDLQETCEGWNLATVYSTLSENLEAFCESAMLDINKLQGDVQRIKMENDINIHFMKMHARLDELTKTVSQKREIMENIKECAGKVETHYLAIEQKIPDTIDDEDLVDKLRSKVREIKDKLTREHDAFQARLNNIKKDLMTMADSVKDAKLLSEASEACYQHTSELEEITRQMDKFPAAFAVVQPEGILARKMRKSARKIERVNDLNIFKLPVVCRHENAAHSFRHYSVGQNDPCHVKPRKVIMMVGMTGAGKSLMINNIVNYFYGVNFHDNFRFKLIVEGEEVSERRDTGDTSKSRAESMTRWVSTYTLHYREGSRVPYTLVLIDTPGFGDTRGIKFDEAIVRSIKEFFSNKEYPMDELSSIGLVIQASQARLTAEQMYVFNAVLNIFGNDVVKNICLMFTFADAQPPPALETVRKEMKDIAFPQEGVFKFNNSAVYAGVNDESNAYYWKFGAESLAKFFNHIGVITPASLYLTKEVLKERETLHLLLDGLQCQINDGFEKLKLIEQTTQIVLQLKGTMKANKDFKVKKTVHPQTTKVVDHFITNCKPCMFTCHDPCGIRGDLKSDCSAMKNGKCVKCPGKCSWESHNNGDRIYVYTAVESEETIQDMMERYNIATNDRSAKVKLLQNLESEYKSRKDCLFRDIQAACDAAKRLEEISLGKSLLTSIAYIERLIESERTSNRPNKQDRIEQLIHFKERAELLSRARSNSSDITSMMDRYEATVYEGIKQAMREDAGDEKQDYNKERKEERSSKKGFWNGLQSMLSH